MVRATGEQSGGGRGGVRTAGVGRGLGLGSKSRGPPPNLFSVGSGVIKSVPEEVVVWGQQALR